MAKLKCSAVQQTRLQSLFQLALQLIKVGWLQGHVSILLAFHKIRIPHEKYQRNKTVFNTPGLLQLPLLSTSMRPLQNLVQHFSFCSSQLPSNFLVTHHPPRRKISWTFTPPSFPLQILAVYLTSSLFQKSVKMYFNSNLIY